MKKNQILIAAVLLIFLSSTTSYILLTEHYTGSFPWDPVHSEGALHKNLHSDILKEDREIIIRLPFGFDSSAKYPVMYVLDGSSDDKHIADKLDVLAALDYAPKTIVVGIPNMTARNRQLNLTPPFMHTDAEDTASSFGGADQFLSFLEKELFPFIEKEYPASNERFITGNSRGGLLVMYSLMARPKLFSARFCYSTPFWRQDDILISKVSGFLNTNDTLGTFVYMSAGTSESDNIRNGLSRLTSVFRRKAPKGFTWHSDYTSNSTHQDNARVSASIGMGKWGEYLKANGKHFDNQITLPVGADPE